MQKTIIAIIPARGGSQRLPRKNLRLLDGVPLVARAIMQAQGSALIQRVIVSTEDAEIAQVARQYGAEIVTRPTALASNEAPMLPVVQHVLLYLEKYESYKPLIVVLLQPTSPLRTTNDIDSAIRLMLDTRADTVLSVAGKKDFTKYKPEDYLSRIEEPEDGSIYINRRYVVMEQNALAGRQIAYYHMPKTLDIDIESDLQLAKNILEEENYAIQQNREKKRRRKHVR